MAVFTRSRAFLALAVLVSVLSCAAAQPIADILLQDVPEPGHDRAAGDDVRRAEGEADGRLHPAHVLPRLLRQCDGSILLDDTSTFTGEKGAGPNAGSVRGFEVIDAIKTQVEASCKATVSCADILALAARDGVNLLGGPTWSVKLGRRDSRTASRSTANSDLPGPDSSLTTLISMFRTKNLDARDMTALSGAHTIGQTQCKIFRSRIYNEKNINTKFARLRRMTCQRSGGDVNPAPLDVHTPDRFDNAYYRNLVAQEGLLHSDQELFNGGSQDALVRQYSNNTAQFFGDFVAAMIKMGDLKPASGTPTEVRLNCRKVN
ncbi:hypothetical protein ACP4OV_012996 [Aristida adscensionis]